jgi:hypothetical protein
MGCAARWFFIFQRARSRNWNSPASAGEVQHHSRQRLVKPAGRLETETDILVLAGGSHFVSVLAHGGLASPLFRLE